MSDTLFDTVGELFTDLGDGIIPSPILKLGFYGVKLAFQRGSKDAGPAGPEATINQMIQGGRFDDAESYVRGMGLPSSAESDVVGQIHRARDRMQEAFRWQMEINNLLQSGDVDGAERYVRNLDLPGSQRDAVISSIRQAVAEQEQRKRQAAEWSRHLSDLVSRGKLRKAKKYVRSLPIPDGAKQDLLGRLSR